MDHYLVSNSELILKGHNRRAFKHQLIRNLKTKLNQSAIDSLPGRILIHSEDKNTPNILQTTFGIANYSKVIETTPDIENMGKQAVKLLKTNLPSNFAVRTHHLKTMSGSKTQINEKVGQYIVDHTHLPVNLKHPQTTINLYITPDIAYITDQITSGLSGLPTGVSGSLVCLLSGGFDSPVAAFHLMSRGVKVIFVHAHSYPQTNRQSIEKVERIVKQLSIFQGPSPLYLVPILPIQQALFKECDHRYLVLLYRRAMLKLAANVASNRKALGVITGDSLGQVASQTPENIIVQNQSITLPIYRPLIGHDKNYIINVAKNIGTHDISILKDQDCCSLFIPKNPRTKGNLDQIHKEESKIQNYDTLIKEALSQAKVQIVTT